MPSLRIVFSFPALAGVVTLTAVAATEDRTVSVFSGVYSVAQAERGEAIYPSVCGRCHGYKLDGAPDDPDMLPAPPIAGPKFLRQWNGVTLAALFELTRTTMPALNPGSLSDQEFADVVSYMLAVSDIPPGPDELPANLGTLTQVIVTARQPEM
jgi:mono/diheme cytochrome c family protein